jgi:hypothetical protein
MLLPFENPTQTQEWFWQSGVWHLDYLCIRSAEFFKKSFKHCAFVINLEQLEKKYLLSPLSTQTINVQVKRNIFE